VCVWELRFKKTLPTLQRTHRNGKLSTWDDDKGDFQRDGCCSPAPLCQIAQYTTPFHWALCLGSVYSFFFFLCTELHTIMKMLLFVKFQQPLLEHTPALTHIHTRKTQPPRHILTHTHICTRLHCITSASMVIILKSIQFNKVLLLTLTRVAAGCLFHFSTESSMLGDLVELSPLSD